MAWAAHPRIPIDAVVAITVCAFFVLFEPGMIVADKVVLATAAFVEHHVVESIQATLWGVMHFADSLGVITCFGQFAG